ncbi:hypothetical protein AB4238_07145, partial [Shewanella sp. 10N.286.45.A1]
LHSLPYLKAAKLSLSDQIFILIGISRISNPIAKYSTFCQFFTSAVLRQPSVFPPSFVLA